MLNRIKSKIGIYHFPEMFLLSDRLVIRPPSKKDYKAWALLRSVSRDFIQPFDPLWADDALSEVAYLRRIKLQAREWYYGRGYYFFIFDQHSDTLIGGVNLNHVVRGIAQMASMGYWVGKPYARHGYMFEALQAVLDFSFAEAGLNRIYAGCLPENKASKGVLKKLGFEEEGYARDYLKINGVWQDHVLFGMSLTSWARNTKSELY